MAVRGSFLLIDNYHREGATVIFRIPKESE